MPTRPSQESNLVVPKGSGKGQNRALVCGSLMEQEGRGWKVELEMSIVLVVFRPGPGSPVGRTPAASAGVQGSIPGWGVLAFFPSC